MNTKKIVKHLSTLGWAGISLMALPTFAQWQEADTGAPVLGIDAQFLPLSGGQTLAVCGFRSTTSQGVFLKSTDAGVTWSTVNLGFNFLAQAMHFPDDQNGWITTSSGGLRRTSDGGATWTTQSTGSSQTLYAVHFINANAGWVAGLGGALYRTSNGGNSWTNQSIATPQTWRGIQFVSLQTGWVVGGGGQIRKTTDSGATWNTQFSGQSFDWRAVSFVDGNTGWVVGAGGNMRRTMDGGATWEPLPFFKKESLMDVHFIDTQQGWVVGESGRVYMTVNGGSKWTPVSPNLGEPLVVVAFANVGVGVALGSSKVFRYFEGSLLDRVWASPVAKAKEPASPLSDVFYRRLGPASINTFGHTTFTASLSGSEASRGRNRLAMRGTGVLRRVIAQSKVALPGGAMAGTPVLPLMNRADSLCVVPLSGAGVTTRNNRALLKDTGTVTSFLLRKGDLVSGLGPQAVEISAFNEVLQSAPLDALAVSYTLRRDSGTGVGKTNDSGLMVMNHSGVVTAGGAREGESAFGGVGVFGQFTGRAACQQSGIVPFGASYVPTGQTRGVQGLFLISTNGASNGLVAAAGTELEPLSEVKLRSIVAWANSGASALYRATLTGPGVTSKNNEVIRRGASNWLRKGQDIGGGLLVSRFLRFWPVADDQMVALVQLTGAGVTSRNRQALVLRQSDGAFLILARTGQPAPGIAEANLRTIQVAEVEPVSGHYTLVGSLVSAAKNNQALWTGNTKLGNNTTLQGLRLPVGAARKSAAYSTLTTSIGRIRSLALRPAVERSGAGGRGLAQVIGSQGHVVFYIIGDGRIVEAVIRGPA
jgi:photosystem II stability/assembly factor-like uncharacterized protein